jgi:ferredoxin
LKEQWIKEERDGIDPELCDAPPCTTCRTLPPEATKPVTVSITQEDGTPTTVTFNPQELAKTDGGCMPACPGDAHKVAEFSALHSLISDIAPGGQYARV